MPLPGNLSEWEHLSDLIRRYHNREVQEEFSDVPEAGNPNTIDWNIPRQQLRHAVTIKDEDTDVMLFLRLWLFYVNCRKARDFHPAIYGMPVTTFQENIRIYPQIHLFFQQDLDAVPPGQTPIQAQMSYRLIRESAQTLTESKARSIATEIKNTFGASGGYRYTKGRIIVKYERQDQGYILRIYANSSSEGREVVQKVLSLNEHTIDEKYLSVHTPERQSENNPGMHTVYGKSRRQYKWRPNATVRFQYASLRMDGLPKDVILYDRSGYWKEALLTNRPS